MPLKSSIYTLLSFFLIALFSLELASFAPKAPKENPPMKNNHVPEQLHIRFHDSHSKSDRDSIYKKYSLKLLDENPKAFLYLVEIPQNANIEELKKKIAAEESVKFSEKNIIFKTQGIK